MPKPFFITTPIYYVNDAPHIGHAYTSVAADVMARWMRSNPDCQNPVHQSTEKGKGDHSTENKTTEARVLFATGTDEHGQKVADSAAKVGKTPLEYANTNAAKFQQMGEVLNITADVFTRTTSTNHIRSASAFWQRLEEAGEIYRGSYKGWYSVRDESFIPNTEAKQRKEQGEDVKYLEEESYFFRLSKWQEPLLEFYAKNPDAILPKGRHREITSFIKGGLKDLSISRSNLKWGIEVPGHPSHVMYVWIDALTNYLTACGFPAKGFEASLPMDLHLIGKDILRFHTVYWHAMLMAVGLPPPKRVFAHGWWSHEGEKMSKSLGNVIDPFEVAEKVGVDEFRYFLLAHIPFGEDGDWSMARLKERVNADLANGIGNLAMRSLSLIARHFEGRPPKITAKSQLLQNATGLKAKLASEHMPQLAFQAALGEIIRLGAEADRYLTTTEPWRLVKTDKAKAGEVLATIVEVLRQIAICGEPFMPTKMAALKAQVTPLQGSQNGSQSTKPQGEGGEGGRRLPPPQPIFPRLE